MYRSCLLTPLVFSLCLVGCGGEEDGFLPHEEPSESIGELTLSEQIDSALLAINNYKNFCSQTPGAPLCQSQANRFEPNQFSMSPHTGEAILIVDDFSQLPLRAIRYKNRLKGFFRAQAGGNIQPVQFDWNTPATFFTVLTRFAAPDLIPAESLRRLSGPLNEVFGYLNDQNFGHGSIVFSLLIEANPRQPVVVLDRPTLPGIAPEEFCDASAESHPALLQKSEHVASELVRIMTEHNVRFVNVSFGETFETIRDSWRRACVGNLPSDSILREKLAAYKPILKALSKTPGVFAAQSAINASNAQDFPYDYPSQEYPNRVLAGYFTALTSGLDEQGRGNSGALVGWPQRQNVDLYLNSGVLAQRPFPYNQTPLLQVDGFGTDIYPITTTATSWIAPLALSRFIHLRYSSFGNETMNDQLIEKIRARMVPVACGNPKTACVFQDPLLHGQVEAVRLGYRTRLYQEP
ncbi:hypothetical protein [Stigmatella aurantiaca]|uniref:Uncharacterized protein n=1 Tax=Stigmatella aurantiaca (strain DW4/3-1) TaxID=378806 RepID=Q08U88_STIAD|nr:hypothetical protein [Stigmatella aurantiaca]ADO73523.1 uncharacterized protein STAUR_5761 [Stigmatella aurantiaca DW4/3-1]EAU64052.1 hypothetical protein STIAU_5238 [Stigmatella aurantiaca DW4/3-1]